MSEKTKKTDLRIQRTQKAIIDAFYELLDEKPFSSITVIDICDRALINRGTFYTHFDDKYQLLDKCISDIMYDFDEQVDKAHGDTDIVTYYREVMDLGLAFLVHCRKRIRTIINKADSSLIFDKVQEILIHNITGKLSSLRPKADKPIPVDILAQFFAGGVVSLVKWWLMKDREYSTEEIKEQLTLLARATLYAYSADTPRWLPQ